MSKDLNGSDVIIMKSEGIKSGKGIQLGELYFDLPKLKKMLSNVGIVGKDGYKKLDG
jgi:hypothetical protein